ncbi:hypothetical protein [Ilumatobacter sp.]|uniref:hypothetical protein n=1 Tax=Ilumatobacter sp. TaxID=1967498 RepID=UPI003750C87E
MYTTPTTDHHTTPTSRPQRRRRTTIIAAAVTAGALTLAACGGSTTTATPAATNASAAGSSPAAGSTAAPNGGQILPVTANPITNTATAQALTIDSVLVENNVDAAGKATDDHLEIALSNTGSTDLNGFEVYYTFNDPTANISESYYTKLPASFTIPAGGTRVAHFDNTGAADHFPVNDFSLYKTSINAQEVTVEVSATEAAAQTATVMKDAGGAETAD